ncbi:4852_t:CDS:2 [Entrophospora sp. SA101]|nr:4852_t:CDS:2 [Entrophospora sp. SA101]
MKGEPSVTIRMKSSWIWNSMEETEIVKDGGEKPKGTICP